MGNFDRWKTPKQIKIARKGDPRPLRRGIKKGERRKGKKARLDELMSHKTRLEFYADQLSQPRYSRLFWQSDDRRFNEHRTKYTQLLQSALKDKIIDSAWDWWVWKP